MPRTHYTAADLERLSCNVKDVETIITFRNEQLLNLWENEMSGQISDGMWENSNHTDWLWKNVIIRLGQETKVEVFSCWHIGRKSFGMPAELWEVIGDRLYGEGDETTAGYKTEREVRSAWREIAIAIANAKELPMDDLWRQKKNKAYKEYQEKVANLSHQAEAEKKAVVGNNYGGVYLDEENQKGYFYIDAKIFNGTYYFIMNSVFRVEAGHLAEAVEELREMARNAKSLKIQGKY